MEIRTPCMRPVGLSKSSPAAYEAYIVWAEYEPDNRPRFQVSLRTR